MRPSAVTSQIASRAPDWGEALDGIAKDAEAKGQKDVVALSAALKDALDPHRDLLDEGVAERIYDGNGIRIRVDDDQLRPIRGDGDGIHLAFVTLQVA